MKSSFPNAYPTAFAISQGPSKVILADVDENGQLSLAGIQTKSYSQNTGSSTRPLYGLAGDLKKIAKWLKRHHIS